MEMELHSWQNVLRICEDAAACVQERTSEQLDTVLTILKIICSGLPGETSASFYLKVLHPEECLSCLLEFECFQETLKSSPRECTSFADSILNISRLSKQLGLTLDTLVRLIPSHVEEKNRLIQKVFQHKDWENFPLTLIEHCLSEDTSLFESHFVELYKDRPDDTIIPLKLNRWLFWSSKSPAVFQILTAVLNEFLFVTKDKLSTLFIIRTFVKELSKLCESISADLVSLYPFKVQFLAALLTLDPDNLPENYRNIFIGKIVPCLSSLDELDRMILLSHFHSWHVYLKDNVSKKLFYI